MAQRVWLLLEVSMQLSEAGISAETGTVRPRPRLLQKLIRGGGALLAALLVALATPSLAAAKTLETVSNPIGSTMNVFDYWIDSQNEDDSRWDTTWTSPANRGINANHKLKFHR
jgi:hypothetical protein